MTPKHSLAVDPLLLHVLDLLDRIENGEDPDPQEEQIRIRALIDQGEAIVGAGREWELSRYALASWIDEVLVDSSWSGREWWSNNVLEVEFYNTRLCNEQFFVNAKEASTLPGRDALEVYYICVILGFRGLYRDPHMAKMLAEQHGLPSDLATWAKQASMSIRLGQGRPPLRPPSREVTGAPPLMKRSRVVWPWLFATALAVWTIVYFALSDNAPN